jgi:D-alanyl-D-alanine carboxypeptidase (penicillin-binding protein 5/6)
MTADKVKFIERVVLGGIVCAFIVGLVLYLRPLPKIKPTITLRDVPPATAAALPWPSYGQAAIGTEDYGVLETHGTQKPAPIASVAKVMTAYAVLKSKPIAKGQHGPLITITDQDVLTYNDYYIKGGSVAKVTAGEKITEYQALQAMMLPSANNFADLLANWAFGSLDKYIYYANQQAKQLGLKDTHISDASGFSPQTLSNARDLVLLGEAAVKFPALKEIVSQQQATLPEAGSVRNVNWLLGTDSVNGIKTGDTEAAGGCYLFSSQRKIAGQDINVIGAIMSAPDLNTAIGDSRPLIAGSDQGFKDITAVKDGQILGYYKIPWGGRSEVVAKNSLSVLTWQNQRISVAANLNPVAAPEPKGTIVGFVAAKSSQQAAATQAILNQEIKKPSWSWRVFGR